MIRRFNIVKSKAGTEAIKEMAAYSALFAVFFLGFWSIYLFNDSGFIWKDDGFEQQYMFFLLEGEWLRSVLNCLFIDHSFAIPMWSDSIGYGADWISSLGNTLGNPINLISIFAVPDNCEFLLQLTVVVTLYLAGASFLALCRYLNLDRRSAMVGVFVYVFSGTTLIGYWQIYMLYPLLLVVLVVHGAEKIFREKKPVMLIASMALCFLCSVNMAYMMTLLLCIYSLLSFFFLPGRKNLVCFLKWFFAVFGCVCLAALIGSALFVPSAVGVLGQDRIGLERYGSALYSPSYYLNIFRGFIESSSVGTQCFYGYAPLALVSVFCLLGKSKKGGIRGFLLLLFIVFTIFLCLPIAGKILNGGAYATNRWVWAYSLVVALIVTVALPDFGDLGKKAKVAISVAVLLYAMLVLAYDIKTSATATSYFIVLLLIAALALILFCSNRSKVFYSCSMLLSFVFVVSIVTLWGKTGYVTQVGLGEAYDRAISNNPSSLLLEDGGDIVYDEAVSVPRFRNESAATGLKGMTFYNSYYNSYIDQYHSSLGLTSSFINFSYNGLDSRTAMEALAGVNRFIVPSNDQSMLPPLYKEKIFHGACGSQDYDIYAAKSTIPIASYYSSALARNDYDSYGLAERQESMLNAVVLDNADESGEEDELLSGNRLTSYASADISSTVISSDGKKITTAEPNAKITLSVNYEANKELYVCFEGLRFTPAVQAASSDDSLKNAMRNFMAAEVPDTSVSVIKDGASSTRGSFIQLSNASDLYGGKDDWAVNLGHTKMGGDQISIVFSEPGTYELSDLYVYSEDSSKVLDDIERLSEVSQSKLDGRWLDSNTFECKVADDSGEGWVEFRIPYSSGWTAMVDGKQELVEKANVGFCSIKVDGGEQVILKYKKPYFKESVFASIVGLAVLAIIASVRYLSRKNRYRVYS